MAETAKQWPAGRPTRPWLYALAERVGDLEGLDGPAEAVARQVRGLLDPGPVKDAISGAWLGHALHPLLTDIPIGAWSSTAILDVAGGRRSRPAAERLLGIGLLAAVPTALTGANDWADTTPADDSVRRIGAVHGLANTAALILYGTSLRARRRGRHGRGVVLGLAGLGALVAGGHLGGHLSYDKGVGVKQTVFRDLPDDWTPTVSEDDVREGEATRASAGDVDLLLTRHDGRIYALADRCTHRGGSLSQGTLADGCVTCPLHASIFRLADGAVVRGPAGAPEPAFDVRVEDGTVEVRARA
jgi:nitrite reductase/ring-hydroxylating ferredoxin subunit/uncharacterized membrane protein